MPNEGHSSYKGCSITTRWTVLRPTTSGQATRFAASFSVDPANTSDSSWQEFLDGDFDSNFHAADGAEAAARRSIDLMSAGTSFEHTIRSWAAH